MTAVADVVGTPGLSLAAVSFLDSLYTHGFNHATDELATMEDFWPDLMKLLEEPGEGGEEGEEGVSALVLRVLARQLFRRATPPVEESAKTLLSDASTDAFCNSTSAAVAAAWRDALVVVCARHGAWLGAAAAQRLAERVASALGSALDAPDAALAATHARTLLALTRHCGK